MSNSQHTIKKAVMRRVYYAYTLGILTHTRTLHLIGAGVLLYVFSLFVSIGDVLYNLSLMKVYQVDSFLYSALVHTETVTLLCLAALGFLGFSYMRSLRPIEVSHMSMA